MTSLLSFLHTGVINYDEKDDDWIVTLSVVKYFEWYLKVI